MICVRDVCLPLTLLGLLAAGTAAAARAYVLEAEDLAGKGFRAGRGYAFADSAQTPGGWVSVAAKSPLMSGDPLVLKLAAGALPPGDYRVAFRIARWKATEDQNPVPGFFVQVGDGAAWRHVFEEPPEQSWFVRGGVYCGEEHWRWIDMPEPVHVAGELRMRVTADPSPPGNGNYRGIVVDALSFQPTTGSPAAPAGWSGDVLRTPHAPYTGWQGALLHRTDGEPARAVWSPPSARPEGSRLVFWL